MPTSRWAALALAAYLAIAAVYTHPLLLRSRDAIASDRYDPVLNASILWWNATTLPFTARWWTPPHYYPSERVAAFTENLTGLGPIATPLYYATRDPLLTYNLTTYLTWPLSALAVFLLATSLGVRAGPAFVGGLAFGFAPYRIAQMAHLQVLACFWLPLALASLHGYLRDRRTGWLALFGLAWLLQALTNGYFMLFGGVIIGMWLLYFCSTRAAVRLVPRIVAAWFAASLPLLPVLLEYKRTHAEFGLQRPLGAIIEYSAQARAWVQTPNLLAWWGDVLPDGGGEWNLFPGVTSVLVVTLAALASVARGRAPEQHVPAQRHPRLRAFVGLIALVCTLVAVYTAVVGPWRGSIGGFTVRVSSIDRALLIAAAGWLAVAALGRRFRWSTTSRGAFAFYATATLAVVVFCFGPEVRVGSRVVLESAPYGWLLALPGFEGLRVPTRFWMIGAMCLGTAVALGLDRLAPADRRWRAVLVVLVSAGVLADGWISRMPMGRAPEHWPSVEPRDASHALIELPLGPEYDAAATYRAVRHRRRVVNGVSGYDPPHYEWLQRGLNARDPGALAAVTSFGPLDVIVDSVADRGGELDRYVASLPGVERAFSDGVRTLYRLPSTAAEAGPAGERLPVVAGRVSRGGADLSAALDGDLTTTWTLAPQAVDDWIELDLGEPRPVGSIVYAAGGNIGGYPRALAVDLSLDGTTWRRGWEGRGFEHALAALMRAPRAARVAIGVEAVDARYVRLRLTEAAEAEWSIGELTVHAPSLPR